MQNISRIIVFNALIFIVFPLSAMASKLPFETTESSVRTVAQEQLFDGVVEAVHQTTVSAQTSGRVIEVLYDVDDFVNKNDVIVRLRDKDQRARFERAEANLYEAEARFKEAEGEFARIKDIFKQKLASESQFDKAKAEAQTAKARWEAAKAARTEAEEQLEYTLVRAPYSGIVTKRHIEIGETVQVGQPLMSGVSLEKLRVNVAVPQRLINTIRVIGQARIVVENEHTDSIATKKLTFFPYADSRTNTFEVRLELPQGVAGLFPGMFVKVAFVTGERRQLMIPAKAVVHRSEVSGVYVVNPEGRVTLRHIRPGQRTVDELVEVLAGLDDGETIALQPVLAGAYLKSQP